MDGGGDCGCGSGKMASRASLPESTGERAHEDAFDEGLPSLGRGPSHFFEWDDLIPGPGGLSAVPLDALAFLQPTEEVTSLGRALESVLPPRAEHPADLLRLQAHFDSVRRRRPTLRGSPLLAAGDPCRTNQDSRFGVTCRSTPRAQALSDFAYRFLSPIGRLRVPVEEGPNGSYTGFFVFHDVVVSAGHDLMSNPGALRLKDQKSRISLNNVIGEYDDGWRADFDIVRRIKVFDGEDPWFDDEPLDYSIWRSGRWADKGTTDYDPEDRSPSRRSPDKNFVPGYLRLRAWKVPTGISVYMIGQPAGRGLQVSQAELQENESSCGNVFNSSFSGCYEARVDSVPGLSGAPWMDSDGCVFAINMEGARDAIGGDARWQEAARSVYDVRTSWATSIARTARHSAFLQQTLRRQAVRGSHGGHVVLHMGLGGRAKALVFYRERATGHVMCYAANSVSADWRIGKDASWVHYDLTSLYGLPPAAERGSFEVYDSYDGYYNLVYVSLSDVWVHAKSNISLFRRGDPDHPRDHDWSVTAIGRNNDGGALASKIVGWYQERDHFLLAVGAPGDLEAVHYDHDRPVGMSPPPDLYQWRRERRLVSDIDTSQAMLASLRPGVVYRDEAGAVRHLLFRDGRWEHRRNLPLRREWRGQALESLSVVGGWPVLEAVFYMAEVSGTARIYVTEYDRADDTWSDPVDALAQARAPSPNVQTGISVVHWLETFEHAPNQLGTRVVVSLCYVTILPETRQQAIVVLMKRYGQPGAPWALAGMVHPSERGGLRVGRMGRSNGPYHCAYSMSGLTLVIAGDRADFVCTADLGGFPYGWQYEPQGGAEPKRLRPNDIGPFGGARHIRTGRGGR